MQLPAIWQSLILPNRVRRREKHKAENSDPEDSDFSGSEDDDNGERGIEEVIPNEEVVRISDLVNQEKG